MAGRKRRRRRKKECAVCGWRIVWWRWSSECEPVRRLHRIMVVMEMVGRGGGWRWRCWLLEVVLMVMLMAAVGVVECRAGLHPLSTQTLLQTAVAVPERESAEVGGTSAEEDRILVRKRRQETDDAANTGEVGEVPNPEEAAAPPPQPAPPPAQPAPPPPQPAPPPPRPAVPPPPRPAVPPPPRPAVPPPRPPAPPPSSSQPGQTPLRTKPPKPRTRVSKQEDGDGEEGADEESEAEDLCDFGSSPEENLCSWTNLKVAELKWRSTTGDSSFWMGGPEEDVSYGDNLGGYALFETSQIPKQGNGGLESAMLMSPIRNTTGATGTCVKFWYSIGGLSPDRLRVLLHPVPESASESDPVDDMMEGYDGSGDLVLWEARDMTLAEWKEGQVVYTFDRKHSIIFEGIPVVSDDINRRYRGFFALDELSFTSSSQCGAFCTFEGGTCGWSQDTNDDFDWQLSRGSLNPSTGPPRDRSSFANDGLMGGYAFIDSSYPRRPGDTARLMSQEFQGTNPDSPLCMRFWTHMYGNGVGSLSVLIYDVNSAEDRVIWTISGEAGNAWYQGQVPIASPTPFKVVFQGEVGANSLGDIAIDDISVVQGACPSAPQVAAAKSGDCTFEVDECNWANPSPRDRLDEMDWVRSVAADNRYPARDHTIGTTQGFYMTLPRGAVQRGGDRSWLISPTMTGSPDPMCIAFWYFMYEPFIDPSGPSLGSLKLHLRYQSSEGDLVTLPVWGLRNHQGPNWMYGQARVQIDQDYVVIFEGVWGSSRGNGFMALDDITLFAGDCSTKPEKALTSGGDCDFQRDACMWKNITSDPDFRWTTASVSRRPANLPDHTFGGPVGYAYFDVFNQNARPQSLTLLSPPMDKDEDNAPICISFWYAYFGASDTTKLKVVRESYDRTAEEENRFGEPVELWTVDAQNIGAQRPEWQFGQVQVDASADYRISLVGMASNGGFAIDDIKTYGGSCGHRPPRAVPSSSDSNAVAS
ncbi:hypothetical protein Pcinc_023337 [Petrolisthes cinctipes]|uniref:MAM domain-containing protein n=1 Tax=Petrolisthes cinctipes TaxID=88211 RepID=A0AAE1FEJ0_PETCI|nr:hypothetical protein Pcinc_023337 [Petrolisthes cinctipes]